MTRYADDLVIECRTLEEASRALAQVRPWVAEADLTLHPHEDEDRGHGEGGGRVPGLPLRAGASVPAEEEPDETQGTPFGHAARRTEGRSLVATNRRCQPDAAGMV
jgi:hypothetical protein